jgi:hypothetical protein
MRLSFRTDGLVNVVFCFSARNCAGRVFKGLGAVDTLKLCPL